MTAFVGQNFGAEKWERINRGYRTGLGIMSIWGLIVALFMFFCGGVIFNIFFPGASLEHSIGVTFLRILAISPLFICFESAAMGALRGLGQTIQPSVISAVTNMSRVILAWILMNTSLGLNGIWISLTIGSTVRGLLMVIVYKICVKKQQSNADKKH